MIFWKLRNKFKNVSFLNLVVRSRTGCRFFMGKKKNKPINLTTKTKRQSFSTPHKLAALLSQGLMTTCSWKKLCHQNSYAAFSLTLVGGIPMALFALIFISPSLLRNKNFPRLIVKRGGGTPTQVGVVLP